LPRAALELAIVVPTFKERDNVRPLLECLDRVLTGVEYEVIFVDDDSPDGTAAEARQIALSNPRVRVLQRIGRRGLASACVEGMMATAAPYIAVMDADLQHDESLLPAMLERIRTGSYDVVVASRNVTGGSMGEFSADRVRLSGFGRKLSSLVSHCDLSDPMSGFFLLDRRFLEETVHSVSAIGFKILLDLVASSPRPVRVAEVPYTFRSRQRGESKLDILVGLEYLQLLLDKLVGQIVPTRFVIFGMIGAVGVVLHVSLLWLMLNQAGMSFRESQLAATVVAMTLNFFLNNSLTYRDRRLKGWRMLVGLLTFYAACSVGAVINLELAQLVRQTGVNRYVAGVCGLAVGSVWNYGVTMLFTWGVNQRRRRRFAKAVR
jgi:dolichol-phosphate mannosyltransferase